MPILWSLGQARGLGVSGRDAARPRRERPAPSQASGQAGLRQALSARASRPGRHRAATEAAAAAAAVGAAAGPRLRRPRCRRRCDRASASSSRPDPARAGRPRRWRRLRRTAGPRPGPSVGGSQAVRAVPTPPTRSIAEWKTAHLEPPGSGFGGPDSTAAGLGRARPPRAQPGARGGLSRPSRRLPQGATTASLIRCP
jgi:hypothetical protein